MDAKQPVRTLNLDRRSLLGWLGAAPLLGSAGLLTAPAKAAVPTDTITVLYRAEGGANAPVRLDPAVQTATLALEEEFTKRGFRVLQALSAADVKQLSAFGSLPPNVDLVVVEEVRCCC